MNAVATLLQDEGVVRLGRALLHFAWQGATAAVVAGVLLLTLRRASAAARYVALLGVFGAMAVCPVVTFFALSKSAPPPSSPTVLLPVEPVVSAPPVAVAADSRPAPAVVPPEMSAPTATGLTSLRDRLESNLGWLTAAWALGVLALSLRLAVGWIRLHQTRRAAEEVVEGRWPQTLDALCGRLRIARPVRLLQSAAQQTPLVMGWLRPVILLPASAMTGLTAAQVEAIIAHELAHIRRHDYLINLLQTVVETLLFYHPAVWWLSRRIRAEREHCCDDLAVEACGDATGYARALTQLEELRAAPEPSVGAGGALLGRIRRLVSPPARRVDLRASWLAAALVLALLLGLGVAAKVSRGDAETTDPRLESLIQGLEARGELARQELHSIRGFYTVQRTQREGNGEMVPVPVEDQAEEAQESPKPRVGLLAPRWEAENDFTGTVLVESVVREHSAWVEGRYRNSRRTVSPEHEADSEMLGGDGQHYWSYGPKPGSSTPELVLREEYEERLVGGEGSWVTMRLDLSHWVGVHPEFGVPWRIHAVTSGNPRLLGEDTVNGLTCHVIEYDELEVKGFERLWICPALGHAVVKAEGEATGYKNLLPAGVYSRHSRQYSGFREVLDGLWMPTAVSTKGERQDAEGNWVLTGSSELEVVLLEVNQPVPEEELLPPPHGGTDVLTDAMWQWQAWVEGAEARSDALASEMAGPAEERKGKPEEGTAAPSDDEAPTAEAEQAGDYVLFMAPHFYIWKGGASEGEAERTEEAFLIFISATPNGRPLSPEIDAVRDHGLVVIAPDKRYRVSGEDLPALLQWLKENAAAEKPQAKTVQIDAQGLDIEHVLQAVSRSTGVIILLRRGVEGPITLKANLPADPEVLLDAICEAKGLHWWRGIAGAYIVSARPRPGTSRTDATPKLDDDALRMGLDLIDLKFLDASYVAWLFGQAELLAGAFYVPPASLGIGEQTFEAAADGGRAAEGPWKDMMPEKARILPPSDFTLGPKQLIVGGTPEAIAEFRELIALIDREPRQVILEITSFPGPLLGADESNFAEGEPDREGATPGPFLRVWSDVDRPTEIEVDRLSHARVASMHLLPTFTTLSDTVLFVAIPRINSDGTITIHAEARQSDRALKTPDDFEAAMATATSLAQTVVNVRDGEPVRLALYFEEAWHIVIVTARILSEADEED